jgi:hypothetical protein
LVPAKHGIDRLGELIVVRFIDAASVHPGVLYAIKPCLCRAEPNLLVASLILPSAVDQVFKRDLFGVWALCVRQYGIVRYIVNQVLRQLELAVAAF